ncbi:putative Low-affinity zinc transporter of the plasma membrane [Polychaeton citri CBS 116435]|uniref:Low-affinity zinc transporter of the plasma membrane n=1 Tax=Polychaeton citri CBS 116435 TaxID=1314669 RepID=A0A9P4Q157_9PEZI|nr:putative Low-affinity zinc transporter of the plasma membrane [Polychaeton citri CBS 116435]
MQDFTFAGHLFARADEGECSDNGYDGRMGVRISSIFVILVGGLFGAWFPTFAARHQGVGVPAWVFFIAKYFGSGVIIATAFIHLLAPAVDALTDPCLSGPITQYDWAEGICLMTIFVMFFVELMVMRYGNLGQPHTHDIEIGKKSKTIDDEDHKTQDSKSAYGHGSGDLALDGVPGPAGSNRRGSSHIPGDDHLGHARDHPDDTLAGAIAREPTHGEETFDAESYAAQITAIFILEFGVVFHSVFIGLTLAVTGDGFNTLYVVLVFHQTFEGLALGSRLASVDWPRSKYWTPYLLAFGYSLSTPIAIAIGLGVRTSFKPGSPTTLMTNGIFDSISAGILVYTGLVELMAHEFMFSSYMQRAPISIVLSAVVCMCFGAGLMALLGKWA